MAIAITPDPGLRFAAPVYEWSEELRPIVFRVALVAGAVLITIASPLHGAWIPAVALGALLITHPISSDNFRTCFEKLGLPPAKMAPDIPLGAPRGLQNAACDCALNSVFHFLESDPNAAAHLRKDQGEYGKFLQSYDAAIRDNLAVAVGPSSLREIFHRLFPRVIHSSSYVQMDAEEVMTQILDPFPNPLKMHIQITRYLDESRLPPVSLHENPSSSEERVGHLSLPMNGTTLEDLLYNFMDSSPDVNIVREGANFSPYSYPVVRETVQFLEAPPALRLQLKRFYSDGGLLKNGTPIQIPPTLELPLASKKTKTYRLVSFVRHGGSLQSGHYIAGQIMNGRAYLMNDEKVTLASQQAWENHLQQAYLLCYLPQD